MSDDTIIGGASFCHKCGYYHGHGQPCPKKLGVEDARKALRKFNRRIKEDGA